MRILGNYFVHDLSSLILDSVRIADISTSRGLIPDKQVGSGEGAGGSSIRKLHWSYWLEAVKKKLIFGAFCLHNKSNTKHWYCIVHFRKIMKENLDQIWNFGFWVRPEEYERTSIRITGIGIEMWRITSRFSAQNRRPFDIHRSKIRTFLLAIQTGNTQAKYVVKGGAKRTHVFQIIVTLLIFNIKKLCQHQNNL